MMQLDKKQSGFTLLELLVTVIIGVFITLAATSFMSSSTRNYHTQDMTARIQENARFALAILEKDLRQAGYYGCTSNVTGIPASPIGGMAESGETLNGVEEEVDGLTDTQGDMLVINFASSLGGAVEHEGDPEDKAESLFLVKAGTEDEATDVGTYFSVGDEVVVGDCLKGETTFVKSITSNVMEFDTPLSTDYNDVTTVRALSTVSYRVGMSDDTNISTLYRVKGTEAEPIVEGVDYMRILVGIDSNGDTLPDEYRPIEDGLLDGARVVSLKVGLLLRSISNDARSEDNDGQYGSPEVTEGGPYTLLDKTDIDPGDARVTRRRLETTILLRNQLREST